MRFKNYVNNFSKKNRIFSNEDMYNMSLGNMFDNEDELYSQYKSIGFPTRNELETSPNVQWVEPYTNQDGTKDGGFWQSILQQEYQNPILENSQQTQTLFDNKNSLPRHTIVGQMPGSIIQATFPQQAVKKYLTTPNQEINNPQQVQQEQRPLLEEIQKQTQVQQNQEPEQNIPKEGNIQDGSITGGAASVDNNIDDIVNNINNILGNKKSDSVKELEDNIMSSKEYLDKPDYYTPFIINNALIAFNESKNKLNPDAKELMDIALSGKEFLPGNSLEYNTLDKGSGKEINEKYNLNGTNKYIPDNYFGVEYAPHSSLSKNLSNSEKLQEQIRAQYDSKTGKFKTEKIEINLMNDDKNLAYSIGHCTILDPKILPDGTFSGKVFDKYDYEWHEPDGTKTTKMNNSAYILQKAGVLRNYYIIAPIKFKL